MKLAQAVFVGILVVQAVALCGVVYVVVHFVTKFW